MLTDIEDLGVAEKEASLFVTPIVGSEFIEIRDSSNETITIGYFDGRVLGSITDAEWGFS